MTEASEIIADMKDDEYTAKEYAEMAIAAVYDGNAWGIDIMRSMAKISKNRRAWNIYSGNSRDFDIWIEATASVGIDEFIIIGAYLSDIWQITGSNDEELVSHMYIRKFKEVK